MKAAQPRAVKRSARQARKVPGVAQAEGQVKGAVADESDLAIARYDSLTADEINARLPELSQVDLAKVDSYEAPAREPHDRRSTASARSAATSRGRLRRAHRGGRPGSALGEADDDRVKQVREYERAHRTAPASSRAAERQLTTV